MDIWAHIEVCQVCLFCFFPIYCVLYSELPLWEVFSTLMTAGPTNPESSSCSDTLKASIAGMLSSSIASSLKTTSLARYLCTADKRKVTV